MQATAPKARGGRPASVFEYDVARRNEPHDSFGEGSKTRQHRGGRRVADGSRQLFVALCRRYGINPFRYRRMHRQTVIVKGPRSFIEQVLWPEFRELSAALSTYLAAITEKLIREEVHGETADAEEREEPRRVAR